VFGDIVADRLEEHFLLGLTQIDPELLEGNDGVVAGIVVVRLSSPSRTKRRSASETEGT
jgi:hypothetical protein